MRRRLLHPPKSRYNYITATFNVIDTTNPTQILGWNQDDTSITFDMSQVYNIIIDDDVIITPRTHYMFNTTSNHKVVYYLNTMVSMYNMFRNCVRLTSVDLTNVDTNNVINMRAMFHMCNNLTNIIFNNEWDTSKVTSMEGMFNGCNNTDFTYLNLKQTYPLVTNFKHMFAGCVNMYTLTMIGDLNNGLTSSNCENMFYNMPNYGNFYYNANEPIYSSVITPMLIAKHWSCEAS